jgi:predicted ArsR family transcriptional regulator
MQKIEKLLSDHPGETFSPDEVAEEFGITTKDAQIALDDLHRKGICQKITQKHWSTGKPHEVYTLGVNSEEFTFNTSTMSRTTTSNSLNFVLGTQTPEVVIRRRKEIIQYLSEIDMEVPIRQIQSDLKEEGFIFQKKQIDNDLRFLLDQKELPISKEEKFDAVSGKTISFWKWDGEFLPVEEEVEEVEEFEEDDCELLEDTQNPPSFPSDPLTKTSGQSIKEYLNAEGISTLGEFLDHLSTDMLKKIHTHLQNNFAEKNYRKTIIG